MYYLHCHSQEAAEADAQGADARPWACLWQGSHKRAILAKLSILAAYPVPLWRRFRIFYARSYRRTPRVVAEGTIRDGAYTVENKS